MKRSSCFLLLYILLASCATAPAFTATKVPTKPLAFTNTPEAPTSTETPTMVPTSTETPDPMAGAPEGATGKNAKGEWIKTATTESGKTFEYTWDTERESWYRSFFDGYVWDRPQEANDQGTKNQLYMSVSIDSAIDGEQQLPTLTHHDNVDPNNTMNWTAFFQDTMFKQMGDAGMFSNPRAFDMIPWFDGSHKFHFNFKNADGPQEWGLWDGSTITVHIRNDFDELQKNVGINGFSESKGSNLYGLANSYIVKIWTEDGNLFVDIAPNLRPATVWTDKQIMEMFMFGPAAVMEQASYLTNSQDVTNLPDLTLSHSGVLLSRFVLNQDRFKLFDIEQ